MTAPLRGAPSGPLTSPETEDVVCAKPASAQNTTPKAGKATLRNIMKPPNFGIAGIKFPVYYTARFGSSARAAGDAPLAARENLTDGIDAAALTFKICAHHHFAD